MSISKETIGENTKSTNHFNQQSLFFLSDINRMYRREEAHKNKLQAIMENNSLLSARIKIFDATIKDQRSSIIFQLNELSKTMNSKASKYVDQKMDRDKFKDNQTAIQTIKSMIEKFQVVQKQTKITKKVYQSLNAIHENYYNYSHQIENLVKVTQKSNNQYEDRIRNIIDEKKNQIREKQQHNQDTFDDTQAMIKQIDEYEAQRLKLAEEQKELQKYFKELEKAQQQSKKKLEKFQEWAQIVIDKNHRKIFNAQTEKKQLELRSIKLNNKQLQMQLSELQNEQSLLKSQLRQKQNDLRMTKVKPGQIKKKRTVNNCVQNKKSILS